MVSRFVRKWNNTGVKILVDKSIYAKRRLMLLGTKTQFKFLDAETKIDENKFLQQSVTIPFRADVRKPTRIIIIGGSRIGKSTLVSNILDDLQNDFNVPTITLRPKGYDDLFHNKKGKGKFLAPEESGRSLNNRLFMPYYSQDEAFSDIQMHLEKFAFELFDFNPDKEPGFMEDSVADQAKQTYTYISILFDKFPHLRNAKATEFFEFIEKHCVTNLKHESSSKIYIPFSVYQSLIQRLNGAIARKFFYDRCTKLNSEMIIGDWNKGLSHSFSFFAASNDPRVQSYSAKILQIYQIAKQKDNLIRRKTGGVPRPIWLVVDDAREVINASMKDDTHRAKREIERCVYMFGEDGWNVIMIFHNASEVPKGLLKESDFIICSKLDKEDAKYLPNEYLQSAAQKLFVKPHYYYNEWAVYSKDGVVRRFFAIDSRVGLR